MNMRWAVAAAIIGSAVGFCGDAFAHPADENPDPELPDVTRYFRYDRLGLYIHWGLATELCAGNDVLEERSLPFSDYQRLASFFNPARFSAAELVALTKASGARYMVFSCKGSDGLAMWNSNSTEWNVVQQTPFAKDVVKDLAETCQDEGINFFAGYSPVDWQRDVLLGVAPGSNTNAAADSTTACLETARAHMRELITNYTTIDGVWLDGWCNTADRATQRQALNAHIRDLLPNGLIGSVESGEGIADQNFEVFAGEVPAPAAADAETTALAYRDLPPVMTATVNNSRIYNIGDNEFKSVRELVQMLVRAAGNDSNLVLHIGAMPNGQIQPEIEERLRRLGMWLAKNGESIYSTRGGPLAPQPWGVTTHRRHRIYVHVLDPDVTTVTLQVPLQLRTARYLSDESEAPFQQDENGVTISLRPERRGDMLRTLVLETKQYDSRWKD